MSGWPGHECDAVDSDKYAIHNIPDAAVDKMLKIKSAEEWKREVDLLDIAIDRVYADIDAGREPTWIDPFQEAVMESSIAHAITTEHAPVVVPQSANIHGGRRVCTACKITKPTDDFYVQEHKQANGTRRLYYSGQCKDCGRRDARQRKAETYQHRPRGLDKFHGPARGQLQYDMSFMSVPNVAIKHGVSTATVSRWKKNIMGSNGHPA